MSTQTAARPIATTLEVERLVTLAWREAWAATLRSHSLDEQTVGLAGVQLKFSMLARADRMTLPAYGEGGDWIVKLPDHQHPDVPRNEYATTSACGIRSAMAWRSGPKRCCGWLPADPAATRPA